MMGRSKKEISTEYNEYCDRTHITADMSAVALRLILEVMLDVREEIYQMKNYMIYNDIPKE